MNRDVNDEEFIGMMQLWVYKNATYPLELITFFQVENGEKIIAISDYCNPDNYLYLGAKSYATYQAALSKVGALMDRMDYQKTLNAYKASSPLSCPEFCEGYDSKDQINPYTSERGRAEWDAGRTYRMEQNSLGDKS